MLASDGLSFRGVTGANPMK